VTELSDGEQSKRGGSSAAEPTLVTFLVIGYRNVLRLIMEKRSMMRKNLLCFNGNISFTSQEPITERRHKAAQKEQPMKEELEQMQQATGNPTLNQRATTRFITSR